jgi:hypothetical protein
LEHRASNPVSVKNLTAIETSTIVKLLRPYVPVGTKRTSKTTICDVIKIRIFCKKNNTFVQYKITSGAQANTILKFLHRSS